jgi:hypothetical protein
MSAAVIACGALAFDVSSIARRRGWEVDVHPVPALLHSRPERIAPAVAKLCERYDTVLVAYGDCGTYGALDALGVKRLQADDCYSVFGRDEVAEALAQEPGTYFLTDFLARTFEHTVVRELGLDRHPELRDDYFRHYTRVLWLAQRPTPATRVAAERAAGRLGLPLHVVKVGNAGLERELERMLDSDLANLGEGDRVPVGVGHPGSSQAPVVEHAALVGLDAGLVVLRERHAAGRKLVDGLVEVVDEPARDGRA